MKYTPEQINELDGLELRAAVAEYVMGISIVRKSQCISELTHLVPDEFVQGDVYRFVPHYERDHNAMMQVVGEMREKYNCALNVYSLIGNSYRAAFVGEISDFVEITSDAESLPVAVCRAALLYVCEQGENEC